MQTGTKKLLLISTALFVAAGAHLGAKLVSRYIAGKLETEEKREAPRGPDGLRPEAAPRLADYDIIGDRNVFNDNPRPPGEMPPPPSSLQPEVPKIEPVKLDALLVATAPRTVGASFAIFQEGNQSKLITVGEQVSPGVALKEVQKEFVVVSLNGVDQRIELFGKTGPGQSQTSSGRPMGPRGRPSAPPAPGGEVQPAATTPPSDTIRQTSENSWVIDRREIDDAVANMSSLMTQIRVTPNLTAEGQADGFKVFSIRPASLFSRIGLLNGDVLKEVNGITLNGIDQAYEAFTKLSGESSIQVNLLRRGQPLSLAYEIR